LVGCYAAASQGLLGWASAAAAAGLSKRHWLTLLCSATRLLLLVVLAGTWPGHQAQPVHQQLQQEGCPGQSQGEDRLSQKLLPGGWPQPQALLHHAAYSAGHPPIQQAHWQLQEERHLRQHMQPEEEGV
jgi:hypothetical protein